MAAENARLQTRSIDDLAAATAVNQLPILDDQVNRIHPGTGSQSFAVSVDRVSKTYPVPFLRLKKFLRRKFKPPVEALRDVSFKILEGEIFGLIGPHGA